YVYPSFELIAIDATPEQLTWLENSPLVRAVHPNRTLERSLTSSLPFLGLPTVQPPEARGAGTAVAVIDGPIHVDQGAFGSCATVPSPGCAVIVSRSFGTDSPAVVAAWEDQLGSGSHGTNVGGIILGVAPETSLLSLNVFHYDA